MPSLALIVGTRPECIKLAPVFAELRDAWKGRIALQAVALFPTELAIDDEAQFRAIVERHEDEPAGAAAGLVELPC